MRHPIALPQTAPVDYTARMELEARALQFRISLEDIKPLIWRRIRVPPQATMWALHVAIQDAMGWLDYHLHEFLVETATGPVSIGIPTDDDWKPVTPGWEIPVPLVFREPGASLRYVYDFGDDWVHTIEFEKIITTGRSVKKAKCTAGERACPPEDCGGIPDYLQLVDALADRTHPEHATIKEWAPQGYDPAHFNPKAIKFSDPVARFRRMME